MGTLAQCQSGAMLLYVADKHDARVKTVEDRALCAQWVLFANTDMVRTACSGPCVTRHTRQSFLRSTSSGPSAVCAVISESGKS